MKDQSKAPNQKLSWQIASFTHLTVIIGSVLLFQAQSGLAQLSSARGTPTLFGGGGGVPVEVDSTVDTATLTGAFTGPGTVNSSLNIPVNRIQYDMINKDSTFAATSLIITYSSTIASQMIGAYTPIAYEKPDGTLVSQGGLAYTTLFNAGFGVYNYNTGAPWTIDYESSYISFNYVGSGLGLLPGDGVGDLNPASDLPSFALEFSPNLTFGSVLGTVLVNSGNIVGYENANLIGPTAVPEPVGLAGIAGLCGLLASTFHRRRQRQ